MVDFKSPYEVIAVDIITKCLFLLSLSNGELYPEKGDYFSKKEELEILNL